MKGYDELPIIAKDFVGAVSITKTPTKEQIDSVANKISLYRHMPHARVVAKIVITEWEKIRNQQ